MLKGAAEKKWTQTSHLQNIFLQEHCLLGGLQCSIDESSGLLNGQILDYIQNRCWLARNEFEVHLVILEFRSHPWMEKLIKMVSNWIQETLHRLKHNHRKCCKMSRIKMFESCHKKHHFRSNFKSLYWTLVIMAYNIVMRYLVSF